MLYLVILLVVLNLIGLAIQIFRKLNQPDHTFELRTQLDQIAGRLDGFDRYLRDEISRLRADLMSITAANREELNTSISRLQEGLRNSEQASRTEILAGLTDMNRQINLDAGKHREELSKALRDLTESLSRRLMESTMSQQTQMDSLKSSMSKQMDDIRTTNEKKLDEMRQTVDEKLQQTLETRLGESFRQVSERLEQVHQSLGEMKNLANGVGDLKKVLANVSTRGAMGELQLENIISQLLTPEQYEKQFKPRPRSPEVVEFAIRLPGKDESERPVYMPIDSKFPLEDYHNLVSAYETGDSAAIDTYRKALINRIRSCARDIRDKYINPPNTTDFALLFLPIEGLFAEALRDPGVFETLQREMHVILTGPTTLAAILNSLQLGFRSLAIEKRSSEVWRTLSAVKTSFGKFGGLLDKTRKKIDEASKTLGEATDSTRRIERKLQGVQELPASEAFNLLETENIGISEEEESDS